MSDGTKRARGSGYIDINCDLGEGMPNDADVMPFITSASVACGGHAGDATTMRATVAAALAANVAIGAHPSFFDREGFGRRAQPLAPAEIADLVLYQVGALAFIAKRCGARLQHVKLHGALYHRAADDSEVADAVAAVIERIQRDLIVVGPPASALAAASARHGLRFAGEIFVDRAYGEDLRLVPRSDPGAMVVGGAAALAARAVDMVTQGRVVTKNGAPRALTGETICLHGDEAEVVARAHAVRTALTGAGVTLAPLCRFV